MKAQMEAQGNGFSLRNPHLAGLAGVLAHDAGRGRQCFRILLSLTEVPTSVLSADRLCISFS